MKRLLLVLMLAAVIGMFAHALTREPSLASPLVGTPAPPFEAPLLQADSSATLEGFGGRPLVLNFWASWCLPCRDEAAVLEAGWQRYGPEVAFLGIAVNDDPDSARRFIAQYGKTFMFGSDPEGRMAVDYGLFGVPETFFISADGRIVAKHVGPMTSADLARGIAALR